MTDDPQDQPPEGERHFHAVPLGSLNSFLSRLDGEQDRRHMERDALILSIYGFLDTLKKDDLLVLRTILNLEPTAPMNQFIDGQIVSILRLIHKVDADSGEPEAVA